MQYVAGASHLSIDLPDVYEYSIGIFHKVRRGTARSFKLQRLLHSKGKIKHEHDEWLHHLPQGRGGGSQHGTQL